MTVVIFVFCEEDKIVAYLEDFEHLHSRLFVEKKCEGELASGKN